ncbi:hypothetical protein Vadar_007708 [Vaccinium darrowii]|uniref:Uncharacterized protein n=1 Tax=Vaccinium darrowii TaxID=229202 RepID=A0ACB7YCJ0_9ERIC|nr:hypothetical protein Vadar_007708 [Vaccinium darrowii]
MTGDIRIHGNSSTVFVIMNTTTSNKNTTSWRIRPYARKGDMIAMGVVQEFTIKLIAAAAATSNQLQEIPTCTHHHSVPGLVFSTSGFIGNLFHDFTDVLIPLFLTSREFDGQVTFLVTNKQSWWINKYKQVLRKLSNYEVIDIDREPGVHCFPRMVVGLKHHKEFSIEPLRSPYSMKDFREFLRGAYSLEREEGVIIRDGAAGNRPRLLIISRKRTRLLLNEGEIVTMAIGLGFEVVLTDADVNTNLTRFANLVNSCDVMMGVHGAGLTNMVFLPENAIVIQILPLGGMEFLARLDFGDPAQDMNLRYLEYQIGEEESSLRQEYPAGHQVFTDPDSIMKKGWLPFQVVYLDKQNVTLDVGRFRATLLEALNLLH